MMPTIGRIVIYNHGGQEFPAIVTSVIGDQVNLTLFTDHLTASNAGLVQRLNVREGTEVGTWRWPTRA